MITTAAGVLVASLVGSVHCAGMCGGFVCFYTGTGTEAAAGGSPAALRAHGMYNAGRLVSYLALGAMAGLLGAGVSHAGALVGLQQAAAVVAGVLMVAWALSTMAAQRGVALGRVQAPIAWQRALGRLLHRVREQPLPVRAALTGLCTTLLPCGWLYVFVATAGGTGHVGSAIAVMALFWLGTVPALVAVGVGAQRVLAPFRRRLPLVSAAVVLIMGLWSMASHLGPRRLAHESTHGEHATRVGPPAHLATVQEPAAVARHDH